MRNDSSGDPEEATIATALFEQSQVHDRNVRELASVVQAIVIVLFIVSSLALWLAILPTPERSYRIFWMTVARSHLAFPFQVVIIGSLILGLLMHDELQESRIAYVRSYLATTSLGLIGPQIMALVLHGS